MLYNSNRGVDVMLKKFFAALISVLMFISPAFPEAIGLPKIPDGQRLDRSKFTLTWEDNFNGDKIDTQKWGSEWWVTMRKGGYWHEDMARVENGNLIISTQYFDEPLENKYYEKWHDTIDFDEYKAGYYSTVLTTRGKFEQKYGYFEVRCILPAGYGLWSSFWMMNEGVFQVNGNGDDGTEVDVYESMGYKDHKFGLDYVQSCIYYDGYDEGKQGQNLGDFFIDNDPYSEYNTYGLEWNEDEYIFYINDIETGRTSRGGVSDNPEYLLLSVEVAGKNGVADSDRHGTGKITKTPKENWPCEFIVDYVKCYQYNDKITVK